MTLVHQDLSVCPQCRSTHVNVATFPQKPGVTVAFCVDCDWALVQREQETRP